MRALVLLLLLARPRRARSRRRSPPTARSTSASRWRRRASGRRRASASSAPSRLEPENAAALNDLAVALEQMGEFDEAREAYEKALELKPGDIYIQQNYDLFREADDKRNRKSQKKKAAAMSTSRPRSPLAAALAALGLLVDARGAGRDPAAVEARRLGLPPHPDRGLRDRPRGLRRRPLRGDLAPAAEPAALEHAAAGARARPAAAAGRRSRRRSRRSARAAATTRTRRSSTGSRPTACSRTRSSGARWARSTSSRSSSPASSASRARTARASSRTSGSCARADGPALARARQPLHGAQGLHPQRRLLLHRQQDRRAAPQGALLRGGALRARTSASRPSRPTSSSWTGCCRTSSG